MENYQAKTKKVFINSNGCGEKAPPATMEELSRKQWLSRL